MGLAAGLTGDSNLGLGWGNVGLRRGCLQVLDPICGLRNAPWERPHLRMKLVMIFGRGIGQESSKQQDMEVLTSRLLLEQMRVSKGSCRVERMHALGGTCMEASYDV